MPSKKKINNKVTIYRKNVSLRLEKLIPVFQRIAAGDFAVKIEIPKKEDEFTPLIAALSMVLDDLSFLDKENKKKTEQLELSKKDLEKKVEERTKELKKLTQTLEQKIQERTKELQEKIIELEKFQKISIGRELKMIEMKNEIEGLKKEIEQN